MCKIIALVPMRHDSVRVPQKNFRPFVDRPLYHHIITTLLQCQYIAEVVIDTDSSVIMKDAAEHFPAVRLLQRSADLCDGNIPMNEVLENTVAQLDGDIYLQTHSTNPLLRVETIEKAITDFYAAMPDHDSLFSVTRLQSRLWDPQCRPVNHDPGVLLRTQDLPPIYEENSCLYLFSDDGLKQHRNRIGARPKLFEIDRLESWDIDEPEDFILAEILCREGLVGNSALDIIKRKIDADV